MKNSRIILVLMIISFLGSGVGCAVESISTEAPSNAVISIDPTQTQGKVSPYLFGAGIEWTENGNGIFDPKSGAIREDVVNILKPLNLSVVRFPGGIMADYYHWIDGVGPREKRPVRNNPMDGQPYKNNFGTQEFITFCKKIGSEPLITANAGTGTLDELLQWQQFFQEQKFPVRYWEIGNEIYLAEPREKATIPGNDQRIFQTSNQYAEKLSRWSQELKQRDNNVLVGAIAGTTNTSQENRGWFQTLLEYGQGSFDFVALHNAFAPMIPGAYDYNNSQRRNKAYQAMLAFPSQQEDDTRSVIHRLQQERTHSDPLVAITEHFPLFGYAGDIRALLDQSKTLASGLYTASLMHSFMRNNVWMANYNLILSQWFGALLIDSPQGLIRTPVYHVYGLYRNVFGTRLVSSTVQTPFYAVEPLGVVETNTQVPIIDAIAALDSEDRLTLAVINKSANTKIATRIEVTGLSHNQGRVDIWTLFAENFNAINGTPLTKTTSGGNNDSVKVMKTRQAAQISFEYVFPPHSLTVLRWE